MKIPMSLITNLTGAVARRARKLSIPALVALFVFCPLLDLADAAAGDLDLTFGNEGKVVTDFFGDFDATGAIAVQPDGKIIAAGVALLPDGNSDFAIARYNSNGNLDVTFGFGGKINTDFPNGFDNIVDVFLQPDGKILAAGTVFVPESSPEVFAVARYNSNGSLDTTFGSGGKVTTDLFGDFDSCSSINLQSDGKLVLTGDTIHPFWGSILGIVRYNSDGSLDTTFANGGISDANVRIGSRASLILPDGKIVAAGLGFDGVAILEFAVARYNSNGSLDTTFGNGGMMTADFSGNLSQAFGVALQPDGKVILAGSVLNQVSFDFALARFNGDGPSFDICLQDDSNSGIFRFNSATGDYQFTNCLGLTTGGTGSVIRKGSTINLQHNAPDHRVLARVDNSLNKGTVTIQLLSQGTSFTVMDRNTADNTCACR